MNLPSTDATSVLPVELLQRFDVPGPRYTSYPTADRFVETFTEADYRAALRQRAEGGQVGGVQPLSIYVHIPFCQQVCYYCACNKVITKHHGKAAEYLDVLLAEIALHRQALGGAAQRVTQVHFGGGTPTFMNDAELDRLMRALYEAFRIEPEAEVSIEIDPRTASPGRLAHLRRIGFNRISFGVQDFDPAVQQAVHRVQPYEQVRELMESARALGFESINADLIYGLPKQNPESFARTIERMCGLRPDRIALYSYAHLPGRFMPQRRIHAVDLPPPEHRIAMLSGAIAGFLSHGYTYIGMDHFALEGDSLAQAKRQGRLHRNFQGYSTQPDCDLLGLGVSSIGRMGATYSQNAKTTDEYYAAIRAGRFATIKGLTLNRDDLLRRAVIMAIMCQGRLAFESIELAHLIKFKECFNSELKSLDKYKEIGLVTIDDEVLQVTAKGWFFVRAIAMAFDKYLQANRVPDRFSRII